MSPPQSLTKCFNAEMVSASDGSVVQNGERVASEPARAEMQEASGALEVDANGKCTEQIVWRNVILMAALHAGALYSLFLIPKAHPLTWIWCKCRRQRTYLV